uniref:Histone-lysine N-methyltransferase SETDB1-A n=1 Tax=Lygus hesperus TaxID=30085 RepID=A0A0A9YFJ0_LYGHE
MLRAMSTAFSAHFHLNQHQLQELDRIQSNTVHILQNHHLVFLPIAYVSNTLSLSSATDNPYAADSTTGTVGTVDGTAASPRTLSQSCNDGVGGEDGGSAQMMASHENRLNILLETYYIGTAIYQQQILNSQIKFEDTAPLLQWFIHQQVQLKMNIYDDGTSLLDILTHDRQLLVLIAELRNHSEDFTRYCRPVVTLSSLAPTSTPSAAAAAAAAKPTQDGSETSTLAANVDNGTDVEETSLVSSPTRSKLVSGAVGTGTTAATAVLLNSPTVTTVLSSPTPSTSAINLPHGTTALGILAEQLKYVSPILLAVNIGV